MLSRRPELCVYVRTLIVRPNYTIVCWPRAEGPVVESKIASMVEALADGLKNLEKFVWGGVELPPDKLWITLRRTCPQLKRVSSSAGSIIHPECELFQFENLTTFSLCVPPNPKSLLQLPLPYKLLDILLNHCPNLEELTLYLFYSAHSLLEMDQLTKASFPRLRSLHLEICSTNRSPTASSPSPVPLALGPFLTAHPHLSALSIHPSPDALPLGLPSTALRRLSTFVGVYAHLVELPHPEVLETLDLTGPPPRLRKLVNLRNLDVRVASPELMGDIVEACGGLVTLRVMVPMDFGMKPLLALSLTLQHLSSLRFFTLYKSHSGRLTSAPMLPCALAILRDNPGLKRCTSRGMEELKTRTADGLGTRTAMATEGQVKYLDVSERGVRSVNLGGPFGVFERRFRYVLEEKGKGDLRGSVARGLARIRR
ncbi:hypothetical protein B0H13DRAFT_2677259 [Mycena leptocephala]|nr:hypothetical protein B0H13DRAFT_2677259 [Mycena leptocephala]